MKRGVEGLRHYFVLQDWHVFLVAAADVLFQPVFDEVKQLDRQGGLAALEIGLELQYLLRQSILLRFVGCITAVIMQLH